MASVHDVAVVTDCCGVAPRANEDKDSEYYCSCPKCKQDCTVSFKGRETLQQTMQKYGKPTPIPKSSGDMQKVVDKFLENHKDDERKRWLE